MMHIAIISLCPTPRKNCSMARLSDSLLKAIAKTTAGRTATGAGS
ncbi:Uncharacterised protein [Vibrio cholerae]|nr:Uncharacterised protein [Vibrio cholerae]